MANIIPVDQMLKASTYASIVNRVMTVLYSFAGGNERKSHDEVHGQWTSVFNPDYIPMPPTIKNLVDNWKNDDEFCRQFLQGTNPFQIKFVTKKDEIPKVCLVYPQQNG